MLMPHFIAHTRDGEHQSLESHLQGVAAISGQAASKLALCEAGELIGLVHDLGKYSQAFQAYIQSAIGLLNPDEDEGYVDASSLKGKIDHSTAGAQTIWRELSAQGQMGSIVGQILSLCVASHHSGLIDCLSNSMDSRTENFRRRITTPEERSHLDEARSYADSSIRDKATDLLHSKSLLDSLQTVLTEIVQKSPEKKDRSVVAQFQIGLLVRFLFSCLIDADRLDTANFERPHGAVLRNDGHFTPWQVLADRLENHMAKFLTKHPVDQIRARISNECRVAADRPKGLYSLTVPTGGGKTLASLRFALHHAAKYDLDRVIYVIPFTSIIDQNAEVVRQILEPDDSPGEQGRVVLEHHSNLESEKMSWKGKLLAENWDSPVVYTTSVQLLEALFGGGTRGARRMHQLARSVIVFDEIQTLPVKCVHIFNNAINFLVDHCESTVVLCTATQPLLGDLVALDARKGVAKLPADSEIISDVTALFADLKRVAVLDRRRPGGWSEAQLSELALSQMTEYGSCLVIVNTKKAARGLYQQMESAALPLYHLSTSMCPAHRRHSLNDIRRQLAEGKPALCVSTQLIEAGVDIDFGSVIRYAAGLDSIAQAAGRCNRNGARSTGSVVVVNPAEESLGFLKDIEIGRDTTARILDDFRDNPEQFDCDLLGPKAMAWFYQNYFFKRKDEMAYRLEAKKHGRDDTLLNLLSKNDLAVGEFERLSRNKPSLYLHQDFMKAGKAFQAIDAPTKSVIVPYGTRGREVIAELSATPEIEVQFALLREAQQYSVNLFPHEFQKLSDAEAIREVQDGSGLFFLNERFYSMNFGLVTEPVSGEDFLYV